MWYFNGNYTVNRIDLIHNEQFVSLSELNISSGVYYTYDTRCVTASDDNSYLGKQVIAIYW